MNHELRRIDCSSFGRDCSRTGLGRRDFLSYFRNISRFVSQITHLMDFILHESLDLEMSDGAMGAVQLSTANRSIVVSCQNLAVWFHEVSCIYPERRD